MPLDFSNMSEKDYKELTVMMLASGGVELAAEFIARAIDTVHQAGYVMGLQSHGEKVCVVIAASVENGSPGLALTGWPKDYVRSLTD